ncbi:Zn-ribbon domain-containing OB-fold protein [Pollutimonas sp. H1-120]|uniref:Zn-ribbon domain-containing OB-fold protein n=1 Tax=Pollutimonas sp. H1-120 TaxID=3148824 RepID=UPI003B527DA4
MQKPQPLITPLNRPFWDGCNNGQLNVQQCSSCKKYVFYPRVCCPFCHEDALTWKQTSGLGKIVAHTTVFRTHHEGFNADAPYVFAAVELNEGPCIYAQISRAETNCGSLIGHLVRVSFLLHGSKQKIAVFELI